MHDYVKASAKLHNERTAYRPTLRGSQMAEAWQRAVAHGCDPTVTRVQRMMEVTELLPGQSRHPIQSNAPVIVND